MPAPRLILAAMLLVKVIPLGAETASEEFADALVGCIRMSAARAAAAFPSWANSCLPPTQKIDIQTAVLHETIGQMRQRYGYAAALWCAFSTLLG